MPGLKGPGVGQSPDAYWLTSKQLGGIQTIGQIDAKVNVLQTYLASHALPLLSN